MKNVRVLGLIAIMLCVLFAGATNKKPADTSAIAFSTGVQTDWCCVAGLACCIQNDKTR